MNRAERRRFLVPEHQGLVLSARSRLSLRDSFTNLVLVAPTGSGKTTRYVIPNVLLAEGSVVVTDPSGEIFRQTSGHLKDRGFRVQTLSPANLETSLRFNPLAFWRTPQELRRLAAQLANHIAGVQSDPFWTASAVNVLYFGLAALVKLDADEFIHLGNLRGLLNYLDAEHSTAPRFMARYLAAESPQAYAEYCAFAAMDGRVRASVLATARAALDLWSDPQVCGFTATNSVDIRRLRRQHTAIYLIVPEHQVGYFGLLANLFHSTCFAYCLETGQSADELPVFFFLDEFGNMGAVHEIATVMTTLRKRRCSVSIVLQELSQLRAVYGADVARAIFSGGAANKLFFSGLDLETAQYLEKLLGQNTEYDTTFGGIDEAARTLGVPLMKADEIRMMEAHDGVLVSGRHRPARFRSPPFFEVAALREFASKEPANLTRVRGGEVAFLDFTASN